MNREEFIAKYDRPATSIVADMSVESANLLGAGTHNVMVGDVQFTESSPKEDYADLTPQAKVRFWSRSGIFTRWFPLLAYQHYSKMKPSAIDELRVKYGDANVICTADDYLVINNNGTKQRVISEEGMKECQKRLKDLCYALSISDSELKDASGKSSLATLISAIEQRKTDKYHFRINLYNDKQGRIQLGWVNRADNKVIIPAVAVEVEEHEALA